MSDEEILAGIRLGGKNREDAIKYLHDAHTGLIGSLQKKYPMEDPERIKDAYTDSIMAVLKSVLLRTYKQDGPLVAYLSIIMTKKCLDLSRKAFTDKAVAKKDKEVKEEDHKHWIASHEPNQEEILMMKEEIRKFEQISTQKSPNCWKILKMYYFEGYKMKEIAERLNLASAGSVRVQKVQCLAKLRQSLAKNP